MKRWHNVSRTRPCRHCGHDSWCSYLAGGSLEMCRRIDTGTGNAKTDRQGVPFWLYKAQGSNDPSPLRDKRPSLRKFRRQLERVVVHEESAWRNPQAKVFLISRRVDDFLCERVPIRWDGIHEAMVMPVEAISEEFEDSVLWRRPESWPDKWIGPGIEQPNYLFGVKHLRSNLRCILIVEGAFDLLSTQLLGYGVAILGSKMSDAQAEWVRRRYRRARVWMDPDKEGRAGTRRAIRMLRQRGVKVRAFRSEQDPKVYTQDSFEVARVRRVAVGV